MPRSGMYFKVILKAVTNRFLGFAVGFLLNPKTSKGLGGSEHRVTFFLE